MSRISSINLQSGDRARMGNQRGLPNIPLTAVADIHFTPESAAIPHRDGLRLNEVQAYIKAGVLPATVLTELQRSLARDPLVLPPGYELQFGGEAAERDDAVGSLLASVGILAVLMVATLVISFGSFRMASIIGIVAALSLGLGMGALWMWGFPFGFMAIIGSMGLMGVAINDAIVVLAGIQADARAKEGDRRAIQGVVLQTTRHIIATSLTTMAGFAPLVISGGEFWPPMAVAISGGVAGATILALFFVPSLYVIFMCRGRDEDADAGDAQVEAEGFALVDHSASSSVVSPGAAGEQVTVPL
ncbi:MAG: efflux RND transporter permease subunit [Planctomycetota bacterium]